MAAEPGASKTTILSEALGAWFERASDEQAGAQFGKALFRQVRAVERIEQRLDYLTEVLGLFVRHQLTLTAHHPAFDAETQRLGQRRYDQFVRTAGELAARRTSRKGNAAPSKNKENEP
jgi:hypothetical protein